MNNSFPLQKTSKTCNPDSNLTSRQYILNLMAKFMQIIFDNPKMTQSGIAGHLTYSSSTLPRYRNDINILSPYRNHPTNTNKRTKKASNTNIDNKSLRENDLKRPQMTSLNLTNTKSIKRNKNTLKGGSFHDNV